MMLRFDAAYFWLMCLRWKGDVGGDGNYVLFLSVLFWPDDQTCTNDHYLLEISNEVNRCVQIQPSS